MWGSINCSNLEYWQYWNKLFFINSSSPPHLHLISTPMGIRVRVRVIFCHYLYSHGTCCHGNLLFTRFLIGRELQLEFNPLFQDLEHLFKVSKYNSTFPRVKTLLELSENSSHTSKVEQSALWNKLKILKHTLIFIVNGILFLHIHDGVQASQKYGEPDAYKSGNNIKAALIGSTNTETLTSATSLENNITAAPKWSNNTENLTSKSLENVDDATLTGRKCSRKPKVHEYDGLASTQTSSWNLCQIPLQKAVVARSATEFTARFLVRSPFPCSSIAVEDSFSHEESLSKTALRKNILVAAQQVDVSPSVLTRTPSRMGRTMARRMQIRTWAWEYNEIQLARQKADMELHWHPIVWGRSTTKGSKR